MLSSLAKKRKQYYTMLYTYDKRREEYRKEKDKAIKKYNKVVAPLNMKIKLWKRRIRFIDNRSKEIINLGKAIKEFTGIQLYNNNKPCRNNELRIAKSLFYKYGIEMGIRAKELREYIGVISARQPPVYRLEFTKSFKTNPENKDNWDRFLRYIKDIKI